VGRQEEHLVADRDGARFDAPRDDAALVELVHVLHRQAQRELGTVVVGLEVVERLEDGEALVPGHLLALFHDVLAVIGGDRDERMRLHVDRRQVPEIGVARLVENLLGVSDEVHLVHDHRDLADPQE